MQDDLIERLRRNSGWRNQNWQCVTDPALLGEAADRIAALEADNARLMGLVKEAAASGSLLLEWWPEGSGRSLAGKNLGEHFADHLEAFRTTLAKIKEATDAE